VYILHTHTHTHTHTRTRTHTHTRAYTVPNQSINTRKHAVTERYKKECAAKQFRRKSLYILYLAGEIDEVALEKTKQNNDLSGIVGAKNIDMAVDALDQRVVVATHNLGSALAAQE
jgi:hypothetical protein